MNAAYKKLGNGEWMVEFWIFTSDMEMVHTTAFHKDRHTASLDAFTALTRRFKLTWPLRW